MQASLLELQMFMLDLQAARYLVDGVVPKQVGNEHPTGVPTNVYKSRTATSTSRRCRRCGAGSARRSAART